MGKIERLEVRDFKSYEGTVTIGPFKRFTAVMGPNGAGKSNLMDAISFVVGVETKKLRGEQLKDLVFNADRRRDELSREASVALIYLHEDNDDQASPEEDEPSSPKREREVRFERSISHTGTCKYRIQGKTVSRSEYDAQLKALGVLVKARNFLVFQGDVESIAAKSASQLAQFFEEISSSNELAGEYERLKAKKDEAETDTIFTFRQKKAISQERKQAKEQKKEADKFNEKLNQLESLKTNYFLTQLWQIDKDIGESEARVKATESELAETTHAENAAEVLCDEKKKEEAKTTKQVGIAEKKVRSIRSQLASLEPIAIKTSEAVSHLKKNIRREEQAVAKAQDELKKTDTERIGLEGDIDKMKQAEAVLLNKLSSIDENSMLTKEQLAQLDQIRDETQSEGIAIRTEIDTILRDLNAKEENLSHMTRNKDTLVRERSQIEEKSSELKTRQQQMANAIKDLTDKIQQKQDEIRSKTKQADKLKAEREAALEALQQANTQLSQMKAYRAESQKERKNREFLENLKQFAVGVKGRMVDLVSPSNRKYDLAISVALGRQSDAIVVDKTSTGLECIRYMRDKRIGVATFIPLDTIEPKRVQERHRQLGSRYKLAIDVLEFDPSLEKAIQYVLGGVVICDTLDDARELCFRRRERVKAVTLDGHIISTNGDMTGGTSQDSRGQNRFEQKELEQAREKRNALRQKLDSLTDKLLRLLGRNADISIRQRDLPSTFRGEDGSREGEIQTLENEKAQLELKLKFAEIEFKSTQEKLPEYENKVAAIDAQLSRLVPKTSTLEEQVKELRANKAELEKSLQNLEETKINEYGESIGITNIQSILSESQTEKKKLDTSLSKVRDQKTKLENQLQYVQSRRLDQVLERAQAKLDTLRTKLEGRESEAKEADKRVQEKNEQLDAAEAELRVLKQDLNEKQIAAREALSARDDVLMEKARIMKKLTGIENNIEKLRAKRHETLRKAEVEQVFIPKKNTGKRKRLGTGEESSSAQKKRKQDDSSSDESESEERMSDEPHSSTQSSDPSSLGFSQSDSQAVLKDKHATDLIDFSSIASRHSENASNEELAALLKEYENDIRTLEEDLEKMQPNMKAEERFADVSERLKSTDDKLAQARQHSREIETDFERVKQARYQRFMQMFNHVSENIDKVYRELTRSEKHPMGGNAYLTLDNTEEPYLGGIKYNAMPPTKRFRDMEHLSGGEKTVAALALLFAIHSYHPAPFFVMDEIDAALDLVNVSKVSNFIRAKSNEVQCIVISLKHTFFEKAEGLVGIYREQKLNCSRTATLDLTAFPEN